jgi:hypothetical protein
MNSTHLLKNLNLKKKSIIIIFVLIIIGIVVGYLISAFSLQIIIAELNKLPIKIDTIRINRSINYYTGALVCVAVEILLLIGILFVYLNSYRKTKSWFLLGLNVFILALFIRSFLSVINIHNMASEHIRISPYISRTFLTPGFNELNFVAYAFEIIALSVLLYLSME